MNDQVTIFEVGPRDGLQNERLHVETQHKIELINALSQTGLTKIEAGSFVSPKWVPQMASTRDVMNALSRSPEVSYGALTPNFKGIEAALECNADEVAIFAAARTPGMAATRRSTSL